MSLELAPDIERRVQEYAAAEGVSIEELIDRAFPSVAETPEQTRERVQALLARRYEETGDTPVPHKPLAELFAEWDAEDAKMTPEERQAEREFWEDYERERPNRPFQI
jgi:hypothetical protein